MYINVQQCFMRKHSIFRGVFSNIYYILLNSLRELIFEYTPLLCRLMLYSINLLAIEREYKIVSQVLFHFVVENMYMKYWS